MDLAIHLDKNSKTPLYQQLQNEIRHGILQGKLKANQKLPSSRNLANSLNISRSTVTLTYEQLECEGYLETRRGSGTYVCSQIPEDWLFESGAETPKEKTAKAQKSPTQNSPVHLSEFGRNLLTIGKLEHSEPDDQISFRYGNPAGEYFPIKQWQKLLNRHSHKSDEILDYANEPAGYFPLREEIADYLGRSRGVNCRAEQVIIINGSQQALSLICRLLLEPQDWMAMEDPGYLGMRHCVMGQLANIEPIPLTVDGLDVDYLSQIDQTQRNLKFVYVTPSHQFPTGVTLSLSKRIALLQWAQKTNTLIIEDDYDSEYRYGEQPIPALQGMDRNNSVIYVGTFSKIIFPSLRMGYLVVPEDWITVMNKAKWLCDRYCPLLEQYVLRDWIAEGYFERHIRRMRKLYNSRRQALINAFKHYFDDRVTVFGANAGIHVMVKIETNLPDEVIIQKSAELGVGVISAREYYLQSPHQGEFIFGYAQLTEAQIDYGIRTLAKVIIKGS